MHAPPAPPRIAPVLPEGPAGYGALVRAIAQAHTERHPDPVGAGVHGLAAAAQCAWQARLAARLGLPWPIPAAATPQWPALPGLMFRVPLFADLTGQPELVPPGAEALRAVQLAQRWVQAAAALVAHFDGLADGTRHALEAELAARPARRPLRSAPALHGAFLRAWHRAHAQAVRAPALVHRLRELGDTSAAALSVLRGLALPQAAAGR